MMTLTEAKLKLKLSAPRSARTKVEMKFPKSGDVIPAGTTLEVYFSEVRPEKLFFSYKSDALKSMLLSRASDRVTGINKAPGMKTLEKYSWDGIAQTVTGKRTEPDGYGDDGSPSWLLVLGMI
jgi:hypothetical protein